METGNCNADSAVPVGRSTAGVYGRRLKGSVYALLRIF